VGLAREAAALSCLAVPDLLFSYPSVERAVVQADDVFWVMEEFGTGTVEVSVDGVALSPRGESLPERWLFQPGPLTPGPHELEITLRYIGDDEEPVRVTVPFVAEAAGAQAEAGQALPETVRYYPTLLLGDSETRNATFELQEELMAREGDCSAYVPRQGPGFCSYFPGVGPARLEFDARGDVLGFVTQGLFFPAGCRSAFIPEPLLPFDLYPVTPKGLGERALFEGEIQVEEVSVPPRYYAPRPPLEYPASESSESSACTLSLRPGSTVATAGALLALGVSLAVRRRAQRRG
jgi:hypothetical protein